MPTMAGNAMNVNQDAYMKAIMERDRINSVIQPHTHNAQGQSVPIAQPVNSFQPMGPLGEPNRFTTQLDFKKNDINSYTNLTGQQPIAAGGK